MNNYIIIDEIKLAPTVQIFAIISIATLLVVLNILIFLYYFNYRPVIAAVGEILFFFALVFGLIYTVGAIETTSRLKVVQEQEGEISKEEFARDWEVIDVQGKVLTISKKND